MLSRREASGHWQSLTRRDVQQRVRRVAAWLRAHGIAPGDRVGVLGHNCIEWLLADFAILRIGAVTVPAYFTDPPAAVQYVFHDAGCRHVLVEPGEQQRKLSGLEIAATPLFGDVGESLATVSQDSDWDDRLDTPCPDGKALATLIYTSGTTGRPKGVILTHHNLLADVAAGLGAVPVFPSDVFLSFLPVSHAFERTVGHFLPVASGSRIAYAGDVTTLMRDMREVRPTIVLSVPRLYEKIHAGVQEKLQQATRIQRWLFQKAQVLGMARFNLAQQGKVLSMGCRCAWAILDRLVHARLRDRLGGRLRLFISGGAALSPAIARFLLAAGITVLPGYGLTEAAPVLAVNRERCIRPETVGQALPGVALQLADDGELLARGEMIMQGYWGQPDATARAIDSEGWLHTGDIAEIDAEGFVRIIDRKKEIIVLSNGENVPPALVEMHLQLHLPAVAQAMVAGDGQPHLIALIVPDEAALAKAWHLHAGHPLPDGWHRDAAVHTWFQQHIDRALRELPRYMHVADFRFVAEPWTQDNGMLTPTLKVRRERILARYAGEVEQMHASEAAHGGVSSVSA